MAENVHKFGYTKGVLDYSNNRLESLSVLFRVVTQTSPHLPRLSFYRYSVGDKQQTPKTSTSAIAVTIKISDKYQTPVYAEIEFIHSPARRN